MSESTKSMTQLLRDWSRGEAAAVEALMPLVYNELRRLADHYLRGEREGHTLQPTALVHEAYLRLVDLDQMEWQNRAQFFGVAANFMRRILVDYARAHNAEKRGSGETRLALDDALSFFAQKDVNLLALDEALDELAEMDEQQCRIVELRFFAGLSIEETAAALSISPTTVKREWTVAKAWLRQQINPA
jgi:RNA polymerase sigma-70 factor, ECF subfamily